METSVVAYECQFGSFDNIGVFRVNGVVKIDITKYESERSMQLKRLSWVVTVIFHFDVYFLEFA